MANWSASAWPVTMAAAATLHHVAVVQNLKTRHRPNPGGEVLRCTAGGGIEKVNFWVRADNAEG